MFNPANPSDKCESLEQLNDVGTQGTFGSIVFLSLITLDSCIRCIHQHYQVDPNQLYTASQPAISHLLSCCAERYSPPPYLLEKFVLNLLRSLVEGKINECTPHTR